jgi:hypothetical protein
MNKEELMSMFQKDSYPSDDCIKHYRITQFEDIIEKIVIKHKLEMAELEAKVYAYEKIIANSNFLPILKENKKPKKGD